MMVRSALRPEFRGKRCHYNCMTSHQLPSATLGIDAKYGLTRKALFRAKSRILDVSFKVASHCSLQNL